MLAEAGGIISLLFTYYSALFMYSLPHAKLQSCALHKRNPHSAIWVFSLAQTGRMFDRRHYRAPSFGHDIRANLKNVAVPGTGVPLHLFFIGIVPFLLFLTVVYPVAVLLASAILCNLLEGKTMSSLVDEHLLRPRHWFALWRLNCFLVAWHAMACEADDVVASQYRLEGKGDFLMAAEAAGDIPISPFRRDLGTLFAKHVHIEGGE